MVRERDYNCLSEGELEHRLGMRVTHRDREGARKISKEVYVSIRGVYHRVAVALCI